MGHTQAKKHVACSRQDVQPTLSFHEKKRHEVLQAPFWEAFAAGGSQGRRLCIQSLENSNSPCQLALCYQKFFLNHLTRTSAAGAESLHFACAHHTYPRFLGTGSCSIPRKEKLFRTLCPSVRPCLSVCLSVWRCLSLPLPPNPRLTERLNESRATEASALLLLRTRRLWATSAEQLLAQTELR